MKTYCYILFFLLVLAAACKQKKPIVFDSCCPSQRVRFPATPPNAIDTNNFLTEKKIKLSKDSSFIGMWHRLGSTKDMISLYYSKNNKLFSQHYLFFTFKPPSEIEKTIPREQKILVKDGVDYIVEPHIKSVDEAFKRDLARFISEDGENLYSCCHWRGYRKVDSITQPFAEREAYLDYCAKADSNTIAWFASGMLAMRWYQKDNIDYFMIISNYGYECSPIKIKKRRKGFELFSPKGSLRDWISLDTTLYFTPTQNFSDTLSTSYRVSSDSLSLRKFYNNKFMYHLFDYKGAYIPH